VLSVGGVRFVWNGREQRRLSIAQAVLDLNNHLPGALDDARTGDDDQDRFVRGATGDVIPTGPLVVFGRVGEVATFLLLPTNDQASSSWTSRIRGELRSPLCPRAIAAYTTV
jgi:hypothetical protein